MKSPWYSPIRILKKGFSKVESASSATWDYLFSPSKVPTDSSDESPMKKQKVEDELCQEH